jgi:hypothetical protein
MSARASTFAVATLVSLLALTSPQSVWASDARADATFKDIEATLGIVPGFFKLFPAVGIAGAWDEFKMFQLNPNTALDGKTKELIGLAVRGAGPLPVLHLLSLRRGKSEWRHG